MNGLATMAVVRVLGVNYCKMTMMDGCSFYLPILILHVQVSILETAPTLRRSYHTMSLTQGLAQDELVETLRETKCVDVKGAIQLMEDEPGEMFAVDVLLFHVAVKPMEVKLTAYSPGMNGAKRRNVVCLYVSWMHGFTRKCLNDDVSK